MEVGDEKRVNGVLMVWVKCPDCGFERWVKRTNVRQATFTGLCKPCTVKLNGSPWLW